MKTSPKISVAASAIIRHVADGGWIGASFPLYIRECRRLNSDEYRGARALAQRRWPDVWWFCQRNFIAAAERWED